MLHMLLISFVGKYCVYMECQRLSSRTATSSSLATFGRPYAPSSKSSYSSPRLTILKPTAKQGEKPHTLSSTSSTHQEEHQGVGGVPTYRRVRLQPSKTLNNRQVSFRGCLRIQPIVTIGHSSSTTPRAHQFGRKCTSDTSQEGA